MTATPWPDFADLDTVGDPGEHSSWGVFGPDDELGTINFITAASVAAAAASVTAGEVVTMSLPLHEPGPPLAPGRETYHHEVMHDRGGSDDRLDNFFPQGSTQWDGLGHIRYREFGYYGGRDDDDLDTGRLGIDVIARHGIVGRGVLVDWAGWRAATDGASPDVTTRTPITADDLDAVLAWQGTEPADGDILLLRTGWLEWYLGLEPDGRTALAGSLHNGEDGLRVPGLAPSADTAAWLWDHRVAAAAADTPTLEALPVQRADGFLHRRVLALLGMPIGELWDLSLLADACERHDRHHFLITASPLPLARGIGSPVNPHGVF